MPVTATLEIASTEAPVEELVNVADCVKLAPMPMVPFASLFGVNVTEGRARPVPLRLIVCGLLVASPSVMVTAPVTKVARTGTNVMLMMQLCPALRLLPQVLDWLKFVPATMLVMLREVDPILVSVTDCELLLVPIVCEPNVRLVVESLTLLAGTVRNTTLVRVVLPRFANTGT